MCMCMYLNGHACYARIYVLKRLGKYLCVCMDIAG